MTGKITLKPNEYQPRRSELEAEVSLSLDTPGETLDETFTGPKRNSLNSEFVDYGVAS